MWALIINLSAAKTYVQPTVEFLSSIKFDGKTISYRLLNKNYRTTIEALNNALSLPQRGTDLIGSKIARDEFWEDVAIDVRKVFYKEAKSITDPALRYVQQVLSQVIFATGASTTAVSEQEIFFMMCMRSDRTWPINQTWATSLDPGKGSCFTDVSLSVGRSLWWRFFCF